MSSTVYFVAVDSFSAKGKPVRNAFLALDSYFSTPEEALEEAYKTALKSIQKFKVIETDTRKYQLIYNEGAQAYYIVMTDSEISDEAVCTMRFQIMDAGNSVEKKVTDGYKIEASAKRGSEAYQKNKNTRTVVRSVVTSKIPDTVSPELIKQGSVVFG